jgi:hypothetical protein
MTTRRAASGRWSARPTVVTTQRRRPSSSTSKRIGDCRCTSPCAIAISISAIAANLRRPAAAFSSFSYFANSAGAFVAT